MREGERDKEAHRLSRCHSSRQLIHLEGWIHTSEQGMECHILNQSLKESEEGMNFITHRRTHGSGKPLWGNTLSIPSSIERPEIVTILVWLNSSLVFKVLFWHTQNASAFWKWIFKSLSVGPTTQILYSKWEYRAQHVSLWWYLKSVWC